MKQTKVYLLMFCCFLFLQHLVDAESSFTVAHKVIQCSCTTPEYAPLAKKCKDRVYQAIQILKTNPIEIGLRQLQRQGVPRDNLYVFVIDWNTGRVVVHPAIPAMIGADFKSIQSYDGLHLYTIFSASLNYCNNQGWVTYKWRLPGSTRIGTKMTFIKRYKNFVIGCGFYVR